jgi:hypothetical protein
MARVVFAWLFLILVYFFANNSLLSQLQQPALIYPGSDNSFWLLHIFRIPQFLLQHYWLALAFDIVLTVSCIICIVVPEQKMFTWITVIGIWLLYVCFCSAAGKHYAQIGYLLAPVPFLALRQHRFDLLWQCLRYWVCFLYGSAGLYKIYYGGFGSGQDMSGILQVMNAEWLVYHADTVQASVIRYLMNNEGLSQWLFRLATVVDVLMLIGFFTRKFDKWLLAGLLLFHLANYFLLHISFIEQSLIFAPFLPWQRMAGYVSSG